MRFKQSLRYRITLTLVLFGSLVSGIIVAWLYNTIEGVEEKLINDVLQLELESFLDQDDSTLGTFKQISADTILYYVSESQKQIVPDQIRDLANGHHEVDFGKHLTYDVLVASNALGSIYIVKNATSYEQFESNIRLALLSAVFTAIAIALWLGIWLSGKVISPVTALANQVSKLKPGVNPPLQIAPRYADDEVGQLATTFDHYQHKMEEFIQREQDFTADASHELRTPLAVITGAAELLLENPDLPCQAKRQVERIERAGERMSKMLEVLLLLARETPSSQGINLELCNIGNLVKETVEQHRFIMRNKPATTLRSEINANFQEAISKTAFTIILSNLIRNAINYTEQGEVVVTVENKLIQVRDSGNGINEEDLKHIFARHYRGSNAKNSGSGIGLCIVKRICDRQNIRLDIHSERGVGTIVNLRF